MSEYPENVLILKFQKLRYDPKSNVDSEDTNIRHNANFYFFCVYFKETINKFKCVC